MSLGIAALLLLLLLLLLECGGAGDSADGEEIGLPERVDAVDGGADAPTLDAALDARLAPACDLAKPFGPPVRLAELDIATHRASPRLSADELTLYFTTAGAVTGADLSTAVRASRLAPFGGERVLSQSGAAQDNDPSVSLDHLTLWFHSGRNATPDIFFATRPSVGVAFGMPVAIPVAPGGVNQIDSNEAHAYFLAATGELWFVSDRPGGAGGFDIFVAKGNGTAFAAATRIAELSSPNQDWLPQPSGDGLTVLLASDRDGGKGSMDLWIARRATVTSAFAPPVPLAELNSPNADQAGWLSADGCRIWFSSGRATNDAIHQLFYAERPK